MTFKDPVFFEFLTALQNRNHLDSTSLDSSAMRDVESELASTLSKSELEELNLPPHLVPSTIAKLPRLYLKNQPHVRKLKEPFDDFLSLKKHYIDKALLNLYEKVPLPKEAHVVLFTWVIAGGLGDYFAQLETASILKDAFASLKIDLVTLVHQDVTLPNIKEDFAPHFVAYSGSKPEEIEVAGWPPQILQLLRHCHLILQIPTYYPKTKQMLEEIASITSEQPLPKYELVGEFGWIETAHFNPKTAARCMGLHFLEKGIFIKKIPQRALLDWQSFKTGSLIEKLIGQKEPTQEEIATYRKSHRLNIAYTRTERGAYLYLHALLKALEEDCKTIDLCFFNKGHLLHHLTQRNEQLLGKLGLAKIQIHYKDFLSEIVLKQEGKTLRLFHIEHLPHEDFLSLIAWTEDLIGCTGDGSISEAISAKKPFFIDPLDHQIPFVKDLIFIAEKRLENYPSTIEFLKLSLPANPPPTNTQESEWILERPVLEPLTKSDEEIALHMGELMQNPLFKEGMYTLCTLLCQEYSVNETLCHMVKRALVHYHNPCIQHLEAFTMDRCLHGSLSCKEALKEIRGILEK